MRKAQQNMMWIIIAAVLAILVFVIYSFMTGGVVRRVWETITRVGDDTNDKLECSVVPFTGGDTDGDGIRDDLSKCEKYREVPHGG